MHSHLTPQSQIGDIWRLRIHHISIVKEILLQICPSTTELSCSDVYQYACMLFAVKGTRSIFYKFIFRVSMDKKDSWHYEEIQFAREQFISLFKFVKCAMLSKKKLKLLWWDLSHTTLPEITICLILVPKFFLCLLE